MSCGACRRNYVEGKTRVFASDEVYLDGRKVRLWFGECLTCGGITDPVLTIQETKERLDVGWFSSTREVR